MPISLRYMRTGSLVGGLDRQVELGDDLFFGLGLGAVAGQRLVAFDDVDAQVVEQQEDVVDLVGGEVDVLQRVGDVLAVQVALFAALGDELLDLVDGQLGALHRLVLFRRFAQRSPYDFFVRPVRSVFDGQAAQLLADLASRAFELDQPALDFRVVTRDGRLEFYNQAADMHLLHPQEQLLQDDRRERFGRRPHHDRGHGTVVGSIASRTLPVLLVCFPCTFGL